jgi:hypothetical protein
MEYGIESMRSYLLNKFETDDTSFHDEYPDYTGKSTKIPEA